MCPLPCTLEFHPTLAQFLFHPLEIFQPVGNIVFDCLGHLSRFRATGFDDHLKICDDLFGQCDGSRSLLGVDVLLSCEFSVVKRCELEKHSDLGWMDSNAISTKSSERFLKMHLPRLRGPKYAATTKLRSGYSNCFYLLMLFTPLFYSLRYQMLGVQKYTTLTEA